MKKIVYNGIIIIVGEVKAMSLIEAEKSFIEQRISKIIEAKETAGPDREIVIAGGIPVLDQHEKEMKALKEMQKILDANLKQIGKTEYLDLREKTELPPLDEKKKEKLTNPDFQAREELRKIETRMMGISTKYFAPNKPVSYQTASDGKEINTNDLEEYECYLKMKDLINRNFDSYNYYEYLDLRDKTRMAPMDEEQYEIMVGKKAPMPREKRQENQKPQSQSTTGEGVEEPVQEQGLMPYTSQAELSSNAEPVSDNPSLDDNTEELPPAQEEEEVEVEKTSFLSKLSKHKKKILIGLGLTALAITAAVFVAQVLPALAAAEKAVEIAGLAGQMVTNGNMWLAASASEQVALHGANTALASFISGSTGIASNYTAATGVWTFAGQALPQFAASAAAKAAAATKTASLLKVLTLSGMAGGLGSLGVGLSLSDIPKKKNEAYYELNNSLEKVKTNAQSLSNEDKIKALQAITNKVIENDNISEREREILLRKLRKIMKKTKSNNPPLVEKATEPNEMTQEPSPIPSNPNETLVVEEMGIKKTPVDKGSAIDVDYVTIEEEAPSRVM